MIIIYSSFKPHLTHYQLPHCRNKVKISKRAQRRLKSVKVLELPTPSASGDKSTLALVSEEIKAINSILNLE
jgi:hypothetical protein